MANKPISEKEKLAWDFATEKHKGQVRRFINQSYFDAHVQKVNGLVKQYTIDEDMLCSALLHDTLEDCYKDIDVGYKEIKSIFGKRVSNLVMELTSISDEIDNDYNGSKTKYLINKLINMSDDALIIKLCDRLQNISDAFTAPERFRNRYFKETSSIISSVVKNRTINKIQSRIIIDIESKLDNINNVFKIKKFKDI